MKHRIAKSWAAATALAALFQPQIALAQECVAQEDLSDAVVYAMPILHSAFTSKCSAELADDGFNATQGDEFVAPYVALQDEKWPGALRLLVQFGSNGEEDNAMGEMLSSLPEDAMRPFFDAVIQQKIGEEIKVADCGKIERAVEALAPLPPANMGAFTAFIVDMAGVKNPSLCPFDPE